MIGMDRKTGLALGGAAHIMQSVRDIVTTPRGTRAMLREYGCALPDLVDHPINELFSVEISAGIAEALAKWEPRFLLDRVTTEGRNASGRVTISIEGRIKATNERARLEGVEF